MCAIFILLTFVRYLFMCRAVVRVWLWDMDWLIWLSHIRCHMAFGMEPWCLDPWSLDHFGPELCNLEGLDPIRLEFWVLWILKKL